MVTGPMAVKKCTGPKAVKASGPSDGDVIMHQVKEDPSDDVPVDVRVPSTKYECAQCHENYFKSDIYINLKDPSMDWQGSLNLVCRMCWNENHKGDKYEQYTDKDWKKSCKFQWNKRAILSDEHYQKRVRTKAWEEEAMTDIGEMYDGETKQEFRQRLIRSSMKLAVSISAGLRKMEPEQQVAVTKVMDQWADEWKNPRTPNTLRPCSVSRRPPHT
jgi:hypothetical protein